MYDQLLIVFPLQRPLILEEGMVSNYCSQVCTRWPCIPHVLCEQVSAQIPTYSQPTPPCCCRNS